MCMNLDPALLSVRFNSRGHRPTPWLSPVHELAARLLLSYVRVRSPISLQDGYIEHLERVVHPRACFLALLL